MPHCRPCTDVKFIFVPQYEQLSAERIIEKSTEWPIVNDYLCDERDLHRLPRQFICNLIFSLVGQPFADFVNQAKVERDAARAE